MLIGSTIANICFYVCFIVLVFLYSYFLVMCSRPCWPHQVFFVHDTVSTASYHWTDHWSHLHNFTAQTESRPIHRTCFPTFLMASCSGVIFSSSSSDCTVQTTPSTTLTDSLPGQSGHCKQLEHYLSTTKKSFHDNVVRSHLQTNHLHSISQSS